MMFCLLARQAYAWTGRPGLYAGARVKEGRVFAVAADTYMIDIGISRGARVGEYYLVYYDGEAIYDVNGAWLGVNRVPVAVLRVRDTATSESFCEVALPSKGWVIQIGDGVVAISEPEANALKFATFRTTPDKPYLSGYAGRWTRVLGGTDPARAAVKYDTRWISPGMPQAGPPIPPPPAPLPYFQPLPPVAFGFDVNQIYDARLIRTFPLTQVEMYALEIQHRNAWNLYSNKRYLEAFSAFCQQSFNYAGNYLSAYWAGVTALKLGDDQAAMSWFNRVLEINPHHQPALKDLSALREKLAAKIKQ